MADEYIPQIFEKPGEDFRTANSWREHWDLVYQGWHIVGTAPPIPRHLIAADMADLDALKITDLADFDGDIATPNDGDTLIYDELVNKWKPRPPGGGGGGATNLDALTDVDLTSPADGEVLTYDGTEWVNQPIPDPPAGVTDLEGLSDVDLTSPTQGDHLVHNGTQWVNKKPTGIYDLIDDFGAVGDGSNEGALIQAAIDTIKGFGGGKLLVRARHGFNQYLIQRNFVEVEGVVTAAFGAATPGFVATGSSAVYGYGNLASSAADPYPGNLRGIQIDGAGVGGATELLRIEATDSAIRDVAVVHGAGHGVVFSAAQNVIADHLSVHDFPSGTAVLFRNRDDGGTVNTQGAGGNKLLNSHITQANKLIGADYVQTNPSAPLGFWPHDNFVQNCLFEQYQAVCHSIAHIQDGEITFDHCVFTGSSGFTTVSSDAIMLVENAIRPSQATYVNLTNCYMGGGSVGVSDAIRSNSYSTANVVAIGGARFVTSNTTNILCDDRSGGGIGVVGGIDCRLDKGSSQVVSRGINGGVAGVWFNERQQPTRYLMASGQGNPIQVRQDGESVNRWSVTAVGNMQWFDGSVGTPRGSLSRNGANNHMTMGGIWDHGAFGRPVVSSFFGTSAAWTVDASVTSAAAAVFQANGANVTGLTINNGYEGARLDLILYGNTSGSNTVTWPASTVIEFRGTAPQPTNNAVIVIPLAYVSGQWREVGSGRVAVTASSVSFTPTGNVSATDVQAAIVELDNEKIATTALDTDGALAANSDAKIATQKAVRTYVDGRLDANDALVYKGAIDASTNPNYPAASAGHTYRISVAGKIGGASGKVVEVGDRLTCNVDSTAAGTQAAVGANWDIIQNNIDGAVTGPASTVSGNLARYSGTTGKVVDDSGVAPSTDGTFAANSDAKLPTEKAVKTWVNSVKLPWIEITGGGAVPGGTAAGTYIFRY